MRKSKLEKTAGFFSLEKKSKIFFKDFLRSLKSSENIVFGDLRKSRFSQVFKISRFWKYLAKSLDFAKLHFRYYEELCDAILQSGYTTTSVKDYLLTQPREKTIILRHDVDKKPENALKMGELGKQLGIPRSLSKSELYGGGMHKAYKERKRSKILRNRNMRWVW